MYPVLHAHANTLLHEGLENQLQALRDAYQAALLDSDDGITVSERACANCYHLLDVVATVRTHTSTQYIYGDNTCDCLKPLGWPLNAVIEKLSLELGRCDPHIEDGR